MAYQGFEVSEMFLKGRSGFIFVNFFKLFLVHLYVPKNWDGLDQFRFKKVLFMVMKKS